MNRKPMIIDCDPGHDDAMAILWALSSDQIELKAITTVAGNQTLSKVTTNALKVLAKAHRFDIPVAMGASQPLARKLTIGGQQVHGESGLEGPILPEKTASVCELSAFELLVKTLEESTQPVIVVGIGPLTNIAALLVARPDLKSKIDQIAIMGGGTIGNWTPSAEYNIYADPEAAKIVFNSELPILMAGLDVTQKAYVTRSENEVLRAQGDPISVFAAELIDYFSKYHYEVEGLPGCTLHDPTTIAGLLYPELFEIKQCHVDVETSGELTTGMTVIDFIDYHQKIFNQSVAKNTKVLWNVNRSEYVRLFIQDMKKLGRMIHE